MAAGVGSVDKLPELGWSAASNSEGGRSDERLYHRSYPSLLGANSTK